MTAHSLNVKKINLSKEAEWESTDHPWYITTDPRRDKRIWNSKGDFAHAKKQHLNAIIRNLKKYMTEQDK